MNVAERPLHSDTSRVVIRDRVLDYSLLSEFDSSSCSLAEIQMRDFATSEVHRVSFTSESQSLHYHAKELKQVVQFRVTYLPFDTPEGRALIPRAKELVEEVLFDSYEPATAIIAQKGKHMLKPTATRIIHDCVIIGSAIEIDAKDYIRITFSLEGVTEDTAT